MNKLFKTLFSLFLIGLLLILSSCNEQKPINDKKVEGQLSVDASLVNRYLYDEQELDYTNLKVYLENNDEKEEIDLKDLEIIVPLIDRTVAKEYVVQVKYYNLESNFNFYYFTPLSIHTYLAGCKTELAIGEQYDLTNMKVDVYYDAFLTRYLEENEYSVDLSNVNVNKPGSYPVIITFKDQETRFMINVHDNPVPEGLIVTLPKTTFAIGEEFPYDDVKVSVYYTDAFYPSKDVTGEAVTYYIIDNSEAGSFRITYEYTYNGITVMGSASYIVEEGN